MWEMDPCGERSSRSRNVTTSYIGGFTTPVSGLPKLRIAAYVGCNLSGSNQRLFFSFSKYFSSAPQNRHELYNEFHNASRMGNRALAGCSIALGFSGHELYFRAFLGRRVFLWT